MNNFVQLHICLCVLELYCRETNDNVANEYIPQNIRNDLYCVEWGVKLYSLTHSASTTRRQHTDRPQTKQSLAGSDTNPLSISRTDFFAARDDTPALRFPNLLEPVAAHAANTNHSQCWLNMTTPGPDYQNEAHNESWSCTTYHCLNCTRHALWIIHLAAL